MATNNKYKLCPECELNWIAEEDDLCDVCKQLKKGDVDLYDDVEDEDLQLCPICNMNYILENENMCESCAQELKDKDTDEEEDKDYDYKDDVILHDKDDDIIVSFNEIEEEEASILYVNGRDARLDQVLEEGDVISIFPPVGGG
ncbi:MAG: MoaD/ThiS family protein [bacterium]